MILCIILLMEDDLELARSCCQMGKLKNLFLSSLISLRNGSVLGTNIWISIFKWIGNENSKLNINCAVEQTLWHSLIPLFFGTPCTYISPHFACSCWGDHDNDQGDQNWSWCRSRLIPFSDTYCIRFGWTSGWHWTGGFNWSIF